MKTFTSFYPAKDPRDANALRSWSVSHGYIPFQLARLVEIEGCGEPEQEVEIVSYPYWNERDELWIKIRLTPGDPTSLADQEWPNQTLLTYRDSGLSIPPREALIIKMAVSHFASELAFYLLQSKDGEPMDPGDQLELERMEDFIQDLSNELGMPAVFVAKRELDNLIEDYRISEEVLEVRTNALIEEVWTDLEENDAQRS